MQVSLPGQDGRQTGCSELMRQRPSVMPHGGLFNLTSDVFKFVADPDTSSVIWRDGTRTGNQRRSSITYTALVYVHDHSRSSVGGLSACGSDNNTHIFNVVLLMCAFWSWRNLSWRVCEAVEDGTDPHKLRSPSVMRLQAANTFCTGG